MSVLRVVTVGLISLLLACLIMTPLQSKATPSLQVDFVWKESESFDFESQKVFLLANGARIDEFKREDGSAGIGPAGAALLVLAGSAAVCVLTEAVTRMLHSGEHTSGVELDVRNNKLRIFERKDMKRTRVIVRKPDRTTVEYDVEADTNLCSVLTNVLRAP
jgi:hypothetical protein